MNQVIQPPAASYSEQKSGSMITATITHPDPFEVMRFAESYIERYPFAGYGTEFYHLLRNSEGDYCATVKRSASCD